MRRKRRAHRLSASECVYCCASSRGGGDLVFSRARYQFLKLQFELIEQLAATFGGLPVLLAPQLGNHQLQMRHHRLGTGGTCLCFLARGAFGGQRCLQGDDVVGQVLGRGRHGPIVPWRRSPATTQL